MESAVVAVQQEAARPGRLRRSGRALAASAAAAAATAAVGGRGGRGRGARGRTGLACGRGHGRKRAREPEPSLPPRTEESSKSGEKGSDDVKQGSEDASSIQAGSEQEKEVEQRGSCVAGHAAAAAAVPSAPQISVHEQAIRLLMQSTGVPKDRATHAIDESRGEEELHDPYHWQEKAQLWLAELASFEDERDQLAETMRVSLEDAERRKAEQKPLTEQSAEEIQQEFVTSELLLRLAEHHSLASLLEPPLRKPLLDYLVLEKKCSQWYAVASHFFAASAEQLAAQLGGEEESGGGRIGKDPSGAATAAARGSPPGKPWRAEDGSSAATLALPPIDEELAAVLAVALECQREEIQAAVFAMPQGSGVHVPKLFLAAAPQDAEREVVVLDSDDEGGAKTQQEAEQGTQPEQPQQQPGTEPEQHQEQYQAG